MTVWEWERDMMDVEAKTEELQSYIPSSPNDTYKNDTCQELIAKLNELESELSTIGNYVNKDQLGRYHVSVDKCREELESWF